MARDQNPANKGRSQQTVKRNLATAAAKATQAASQEVRHEWLVRHMERQNGRCAYCTIPMVLSRRRVKNGRQATLDHVIPLSRSGRDTEANTVAACTACNSAKAQMSAPFFLASPFCTARKKFAATLSPRPIKPLVVTIRRRRTT